MTARVAKPKRAKKPKPEPVYQPHKCTVLAVDPGETSGWAIMHHGKVMAVGHCDVFGADPAEVIKRALSFSGPLVAVIERPFRVKSQNSTGIGAGDVIWRKRLEEAGCGRRIVRVYPPTWRARILGRDPTTGKSWANAPRNEVRPEEQRVARLMLKRPNVHPDEAPAFLIGWWGCYAGEVGARLPKRMQTGVR